ncbi:hypothetical protein [Methylotuvimicrobium sp.]|uniref:hypothetical protein n=1 Tax=Methylotuvimicrobium sp. TaxID=2822413 RepID=UPI003D66005F
MEQFERAKRYLSRVEELYEGVFSSSSHDKDAYDDDVISFFIHCYHIRDWIIHLNTLTITAKQIDGYIDRHKALKVCADLANGSKHCKLTRSLRTERQPQIAGKERRTSTWITGSGGGEVMKCKYTIVINTEILDALDLARECVELWKSFIDQLKAHNKSIQQDTSGAGASA